MEYFSGCLNCDAELVYSNCPESRSCFYCGQSSKSVVEFRNAHFGSDHCQALPANDLIEQFCQQSKMQNPLEMTTALLPNPAIKMHWPEHHFLVPAVLLTSYYNHVNQSEHIIKN